MVAQARDGGTLVDGRLRAHGARDGAARRSAGGSSRRSRATRCRWRWTRASCRRPPGRAASCSASGPRRSSSTTSARRRTKTLGPMRDAVTIVRGVLGGEPFEYEGDTWSASVPGLQEDAHTPREVPPVYVAATAPKMQALSGEIADGCLTPSITTPAFVRYTRENVAGRHRHRLHDRRLDPRVGPRCRPRRRAGDRRHVPREQVPEHQGLRRHAARAGGDRDGGARARRRGDGAGRTARGEGRGDRLAARPLQADRRDAGRVHRRDRGVPRRRLHARDARALGRPPPRPDPALRREGSPILRS